MPPFRKSCARYWACLKEVKHPAWIMCERKKKEKLKHFFTKFQLSTSFLRYFISRLGVLFSSAAIRNLIFYNLGYAIYRLTIRPGLCGTVPVSRPCPAVSAGWWKCPVFLFVCEGHSKIRKNTRVAGVETFFFLEITLKIAQKPWVAGVKTFFFEIT